MWLVDLCSVFGGGLCALLGDPELLSGGISEAMITTAAGLIIGIPALVAYNWLRGRADAIIFELEQHATSLLDGLRRRKLRARGA